MPFRDPIYKLILPPGATPPTVGQPIIVLDPGPPPSIALYTGQSGESSPAFLRADLDADLHLQSPDFSAGAFPPAEIVLGGSGPIPPENSNISMSAASLDIALATGQYQVAITNPAIVAMLAGGSGTVSDHGGTFRSGVYMQPAGSNVSDHLQIDGGFWSGGGTNDIMTPLVDVSGTATNGLTNTAYATPTNSVGLTFKAPPSGRGLIHYHGRADLNFSFAAGSISNRSAYGAPALRNGSTIGAGTDPSLLENGQASPGDSRAISFGMIQDGTHSIDDLVANGIVLAMNLIPGNDYNIFLQWRCTNAVNFTYDVKTQGISWQPLY